MNIEWVLIGAAAIAIMFAMYKIADAFGLLGPSKEEVATEQLYNNAAATGSVSEFIPKLKAYLTSRKLPTTSDYIKALQPTSSQMLQWKDNLIKARGFWNDDESKVFNIFRNMKSQTQMYSMTQFFQAYMKKSLIDYLDEFMDTNELAMINSIVSKLPMI